LFTEEIRLPHENYADPFATYIPGGALGYTPRGIKGELGLIGYDGKTLAFVEVRTRTVKEDAAALPELSVTREKQRVVVRTARRFLAERPHGRVSSTL
jgi:Holliday junction resolvase-like predicted endonuclease